MNYDRRTLKPVWASRVSMLKLRRLYENDARGILETALLDDVGVTLYCRCESIMKASDALMGRVHCPRCETIIGFAPARAPRNFELGCSKCEWRMMWRDYHSSFQHRDLWGGGFTDAMNEFMSGWESARHPKQKMLLIDRLIHVWHWMFSEERGATRSAAPAFIEGSRREVIAFLNDLSGF